MNWKKKSASSWGGLGLSCSEWKEVRLSEIAQYITNKIDISLVNKENYITTENMLPNKGGVTTATNLPNTKKVNASIKGDILISNIRPYFKKIWFCDYPCGVSNDVLIIRTKNNNVNNKFLYYFLSQDKFFDFIVGTSKGTKMPRGDKNAIMNYKLKLPPLDEQEKIAQLFESFDEKIKINHEINKILEEIAQTIFKHWFIDFEFPNENGEPYKSCGGKFVESELGMIPEGWVVKSLDQIANYQNGLAMQKYRPLDGEKSLPVLKIKELNQGFTDKNSDRCSFQINENVKVYDGDIIFSWSGTLLVKIWLGGNAGLNQHLFKVTSKDYPKWFYYYWTKFYLDKFIRIAADKATTMGHIKRSHLRESLVAVPPQELIKDFNMLFEPIMNKIINTGIESRNLIQLRDALLPKLMSGEIRIPEAEEAVESCLQKSN
mgnify:CR=1 FL=1